MEQKLCEQLLLAKGILTKADLKKNNISINPTDLEISQIVSVYKIRETIEKDKKELTALKELLKNLKKENGYKKLRIVKITGTLNQIVFIDAGITKVYGILSL
ncbi:hypothetical protein Q763_07505 [Flavobacterium beibuense F44-8]|uniref:Uncharacterized protein n=1 Tax=Flavobacterium beibuense F44-8 TaxID=1406840 RepID=A0A0A2LQ78_9FLAO|nr:hypothetical protein [Flavobacterium beibuense]KGO81486.1 hypothetical protein Q763_07505 [Flavobacterium beibuense F44-8]